MGFAESFPSAPMPPFKQVGGREAERPEDGVERIDAEGVRALVEDDCASTRWPAAIQQQYAAEITARIERDQTFLFLLALLIALATLLVDQLVNPAMVKEGAMLRVLAVAPITMIGLFAASRKWNNVASFCVGAAPIAFAVVVVHLSLHLPPDSSARYLAGVGLLMGLANIVLPFSLRGLVLFDLCYVATAYIATHWDTHGYSARNFDFLVTLAIIGAATLPLAYRFERLRQRNFLLNLHARTTYHELLEVNEQLRDLSNRDPLTGLPNRRFFNRLFDEMIAEKAGPGPNAATPECRVALLMIDLDHFKAFNDTHGHVAGDEALRIVGHELASIMERVDGIASRYGGEEFVAALCRKSREEAEEVAEAIRQTVASLLIPIWPAGRSIITTSVGVAIAPVGDCVRREELIAAADDALYMAKDAGRNRVESIDLVNRGSNSGSARADASATHQR